MRVAVICVDCSVPFMKEDTSPTMKCENCRDRDQSYRERGEREQHAS